MGNDALCQCTPKSKEYSIQSKDSSIIITHQFNKTQCSILQGDSFSKGLNIVNCSYEPVEAQIVKMDQNMKKKQREELKAMKIGDVILSERLNRFILHAKMPLYQETKDLQTVYNTYLKCLQIAEDNKLKELTFTEQIAPNYTIPKQYNAECLIRCILYHINQANSNIQAINFISNDLKSLNIFKYELENILEEMKLPELAEKNRRTYIEFLNSNSDNQELFPYCLSTGLTTSLAKLSEDA